MERIGILGGTGSEGRGIALRLASAGLNVHIGSRSAEKAAATAAELEQAISAYSPSVPASTGTVRIGAVSSGTNEETVSRSRILLLAVPFATAAGLIGSLPFRPEHILVDLTVPVIFRQGPQYVELEEGSGAEHLRRVLPESVPLVAAFKTLPAELLNHLGTPLDCDEFICSDSSDAKQYVLQRFTRIPGLRWIDGGPLRYCRSLEAMTVLAIGLNRRYKVKGSRFRVVGI